MNEDVEILIKGCCTYNRLSQEKLYQHFFSGLVALCNKYFDDEHDIVTAMNNGMLQVFNNIEKFDSTKGDIKNWIFIIVRNAAISHLRQKKLQPITYELTADIQIESNTSLLKNYEEDMVISFLKTLTITTRAVFNLFYLEGLLIKEVAEKLEMKEGTVKWHLNEGRNKLRKYFEKKMIVESI